jgi:hypothetical protein
LKEEIKHARPGLQGALRLENQQRISHNKMVLAMLPKLKGPSKKQFRAEQRRVLAA